MSIDHTFPPLKSVLDRQQMIMKEQDAGLDLISQSLARQKQLGLAIGDEVDEQNEMLDELDVGMENTNRRVNATTEHVLRVSQMAEAGGLCCTVFLLLVAIIVIGIWPKP
eukprot:UC4_evm4s744